MTLIVIKIKWRLDVLLSTGFWERTKEWWLYVHDMCICDEKESDISLKDNAQASQPNSLIIVSQVKKNFDQRLKNIPCFKENFLNKLVEIKTCPTTLLYIWSVVK